MYVHTATSPRVLLLQATVAAVRRLPYLVVMYRLILFHPASTFLSAGLGSGLVRLYSSVLYIERHSPTVDSYWPQEVSGSSAGTRRAGAWAFHQYDHAREALVQQCM